MLTIYHKKPNEILENSTPMNNLIIKEYPYGVLPPYYNHVSLPVDNIRAKGCTWIINGSHCRQPCAPFLFLCSEHKDIPDFPRHVYTTSSTCKKRK